METKFLSLKFENDEHVKSRTGQGFWPWAASRCTSDLSVLSSGMLAQKGFQRLRPGILASGVFPAIVNILCEEDA